MQSIPSPSISYVDLGPVRVHFYALFILAGIVLAIWLANRRLKARGADGGLALDVALWTVPIGIIGARIFHVLTHTNDYFYDGADLTAVFRVWEGGIAIYGGLIGGAFGAWLGARSAGIKFWSFADAVAPGILLAQALGRWGNYFNQELFGLPTDLPWGLQIDPGNQAIPQGLPTETLFHPTFIYESIWSLIGVALLLWLDRKYELRWGKLFGLYLVFYSIGRVWTESLRIDPSDIILGLRTNIWSALFGIAIGLAIFFVQRMRHPGLETTVYLPGKGPKALDVAPDALDSEPK
ncbi:prolipoprotein diacylglyceryl transferase [Rhodoluna sp.]|uniref:prolipoprotein diacylglyceryl transferase n=1 Tax=Rhodoluna sp. TaxID=1969481 RepID=UPI0025EDF193|nr:prolipoprotein diacylglyceryl transferase [Rhodoluna sp.]